MLALAVPALGPCPAAAQRAAWLIHPGAAESPAVEVSPAPSAGSVTWRLVSRQGEVLAEMAQPPVPAGYSLNLGQCRVAGVLRQDVLAFVRHAPARPWSTQVIALWIADPAGRAFVVAETEGVACLNEGYGV